MKDLSSKIQTQIKGDIAVIKTILDLREKGYYVFREVVNESLPFDLVAFKDNKFYKIQCKYSGNVEISHRQTTMTRNSPSKKIKYTSEEIDYFAIYCPLHDVVLYPSVNFTGACISYNKRDCWNEYYFWEDFLNFTDVFIKRSYKDLNYTPSPKKSLHSRNPKKIFADLNKLKIEVFGTPLYILCKKYNCSDVALKKYCKRNNVPLPPKGYFLKKN